MPGKYPTHKWLDQKSCSDYRVPTPKDLRPYFTDKPHRIHRNDYQIDLVAQLILRGLGHDDVPYSGSIYIRDLRNFRVETVMLLAKHLAEYIIAPQRYGHDPRNVIASSLNVFAYRIRRFRYGHGLVTKPIRMISKHKLGLLVQKVLDTEYLWSLAEKYVESHKWRVQHGYCDPL